MDKETYPDHRNVLDMILKALWLLTGILLGHVVLKVERTRNAIVSVPIYSKIF